MWLLAPHCGKAVCLFYGDKNLCLTLCLSHIFLPSWQLRLDSLCTHVKLQTAPVGGRVEPKMVSSPAALTCTWTLTFVSFRAATTFRLYIFLLDCTKLGSERHFLGLTAATLVDPPLLGGVSQETFFAVSVFQYLWNPGTGSVRLWSLFIALTVEIVAKIKCQLGPAGCGSCAAQQPQACRKSCF